METLRHSAGWLGFALVLACWIPQTWKILRGDDVQLSLPFLVLTALGSVALALHAHCLGDLPFTFLNGYAAANAAVSAWFVRKKESSGKPCD